MFNPIRSANATHPHEAVKVSTPAPQTRPQQGSKLPSDTVKLSSTGDANHDGDSK